MEKWFMYAKKADFGEWAKALGVEPVVARILRNRDLLDVEEARKFLYGSLLDCHSPMLLRDVSQAAEHLFFAIRAGKRIRVIGDYDVDGICSSFLLVSGLSKLGADVDVAIPHRIHDGYGLNENLIREAAKDGVKLVLTCDNGIAAAEPISLAKDLGMDVIVTDHHEIPYVLEDGQKREQLPKALAVVDPKRAEDSYPFPGICGCAVAYKLLLAMKEELDQGKAVWPKGSDPQGFATELDELLEVVAFATVCDVMELKDENRIYVREGLNRLRNTKNLGLRALMEVNGLDLATISAYHLGFVLGPCLNATGRLDTAQRALELLQSKDVVAATRHARDLKELNDSRKNMTQQGIDLAMEVIQKQGMEKDKVLVVYLPEVHESLAGIIAGRIRENIGRPAFLLTKGEDGVKGSGRSVEGYHMYDALTKAGHLLTKFGGHAMAAGLSLPEENVEALRARLNEDCALTEEDFIPVLHVDAEMPMEYASMELAKQLEVLEPFGVGNPKPLFAQRNLMFLAGTRMGRDGKYGRFTAQTPEGKRFQVVFFGNMDAFGEYLNEKFGQGSFQELLGQRGHFALTILYQLGINSYHGKEELQFLMKSYK